MSNSDLEKKTSSTRPVPLQAKKPWQTGPLSYLIACLAVSVMTATIYFTHADASPVNIPPLYLLVVQAIAVLVGSCAAVAASILAFLSFDWFFVEPKYQFTVRDPFEFVALCVFLVTAILVGQLTALFQSRAHEAHKRELAANAMAAASWSIVSELNCNQALQKVIQQLVYVEAIESAAVIVLLGHDSQEIAASYIADVGTVEPNPLATAVQFVITTRQAIGWDDSPLWNKALTDEPETRSLYLPVSAEGKMRGVFMVKLRSGRRLLPEEKQVVSSLVNYIAVVLQRDQLVASETKAQALAEANRLKTALLQMVSHDFRSPLSSIKASVSSLLSEEGTPIDADTQHGLMEAIEQEADRLNRMVGNLLDLSRLEANAWQPRRDMFSLSELIGAALDYFGVNDNKRIRVSLTPGNIDVCVDFAQMVQVLRNLLENALKYAEGTVDLVARQEEGSLMLEVLDRGPGLPGGEGESVFEPFYRAREHRESSLPGMGLGLAVCKSLVEANGGKVRACNRDGGGAIFCVTLPAEPVVADESSRN